MGPQDAAVPSVRLLVDFQVEGGAGKPELQDQLLRLLCRRELPPQPYLLGLDMKTESKDAKIGEVRGGVSFLGKGEPPEIVSLFRTSHVGVDHAVMNGCTLVEFCGVDSSRV